jgi:hypothetical protein
MQLPEHTRMKRRVDAAAVDQDQQLVGVLKAVEAPRADRILACVHPLHLQVRREPKHLRKRGGSGAIDVRIGDHEQ